MIGVTFHFPSIFKKKFVSRENEMEHYLKNYFLWTEIKTPLDKKKTEKVFQMFRLYAYDIEA